MAAVRIVRASAVFTIVTIWLFTHVTGQQPQWCPQSCSCTLDGIFSYHMTCRQVTNVPQLSRRQAQQVSSITLSNCSITHFDPTELNTFYYLGSFTLDNCNTEEIRGNFSRLGGDLKRITITKNTKLRSISEGTFQFLLLEHLDLRENGIISFPFIYGSQISNLILSKNNITEITRPGTLRLQANIQLIDLSHNMIQTLQQSDFTLITTLKTLDVSYNLIETIDVNMRSVLNQLTTLNMKGNLFHCNCNLKWLKQWYDRSKTSKTITIECASPIPRSFEHVLESDFACYQPKLLSSTGTVSAVLNENVTVTCLAEGDPAPIVSLHKTGQTDPIPLQTASTYTETYAKCVFIGVTDIHNGNYQWKITNSQGTITSMFEINVVKTTELLPPRMSAGAIAGAVIGGIFLGLLICALILLLVWLHRSGRLPWTVCACCSCCYRLPCCKKTDNTQSKSPPSIKNLQTGRISNATHQGPDSPVYLDPENSINGRSYLEMEPGMHAPPPPNYHNRPHTYAGPNNFYEYEHVQPQRSLSGIPATSIYDGPGPFRGRIPTRVDSIRSDHAYEDIYEDVSPAHGGTYQEVQSNPKMYSTMNRIQLESRPYSNIEV